MLLMNSLDRPDSSLFALVRGEDIDGFNNAKPKFARVNFGGADLRGLDLRMMDVERVDFSNAYFGCADLRGLDLRGCNLQGANLEFALVAEVLFPADITPEQVCASVNDGVPLHHCQRSAVA
jgi:uncharacterized protein YjbI with pentapeptide repeats